MTRERRASSFTHLLREQGNWSRFAFVKEKLANRPSVADNEPKACEPTRFLAPAVVETAHESAYPALFNSVKKDLPSLPGGASFVVGRSETADLVVLDVTCSRQQLLFIGLMGQSSRRDEVSSGGES